MRKFNALCDLCGLVLVAPIAAPLLALSWLIRGSDRQHRQWRRDCVSLAASVWQQATR